MNPHQPPWFPHWLCPPPSNLIIPTVCTLPRPLPILRDQAGHLWPQSLRTALPFLPEASFPSFHLGLAQAACGSQLKFLTLRTAVLPCTQVSPLTFSLVSCTFSSRLLSICNSTLIQCSFIPTCLPLQPEGTQGQRPVCLTYHFFS